MATWAQTHVIRDWKTSVLSFSVPADQSSRKCGENPPCFWSTQRGNHAGSTLPRQCFSTSSASRRYVSGNGGFRAESCDVVSAAPLATPNANSSPRALSTVTTRVLLNGNRGAGILLRRCFRRRPHTYSRGRLSARLECAAPSLVTLIDRYISVKGKAVLTSCPTRRQFNSLALPSRTAKNRWRSTQLSSRCA